MTDTNDNTDPSLGVTMTVNESNLDRAVRGGIAVTALGAGTAIGGVLNPVGIALCCHVRVGSLGQKSSSSLAWPHSTCQAR